MLNVGGAELLIVLLVALIFLGPQRLPEVARQLGQALSSLRSLASGFQAELEAASKPDPDSSMTLSGPTDQDEAIASTQTDPFAGSQKDPFADAKTDVSDLAETARAVTYDDDDDAAVSSGGPTDLRHFNQARHDQPSRDQAGDDQPSRDQAGDDQPSRDQAGDDQPSDDEGEAE
jgi:Tat protein translocase TatB subunit